MAELAPQKWEGDGGQESPGTLASDVTASGASLSGEAPGPQAVGAPKREEGGRREAVDNFYFLFWSSLRASFVWLSIPPATLPLPHCSSCLLGRRGQSFSLRGPVSGFFFWR